MKKRCWLTAVALLLAASFLPAETNADRQAQVRSPGGGGR